MSNNSTPLNPAEAAAQALTAASDTADGTSAGGSAGAGGGIGGNAAGGSDGGRTGGNGSGRKKWLISAGAAAAVAVVGGGVMLSHQGRPEGHSDRCVQEHHGGRAVKIRLRRSLGRKSWKNFYRRDPRRRGWN